VFIEKQVTGHTHTHDKNKITDRQTDAHTPTHTTPRQNDRRSNDCLTVKDAVVAPLRQAWLASAATADGLLRMSMERYRKGPMPEGRACCQHGHTGGDTQGPGHRQGETEGATALTRASSGTRMPSHGHLPK